MCDAQGIVQLCNNRYLEMYGLDPDLVHPGMTLNEWITQRKQIGQFDGDVEAYCDFIFSTAARRRHRYDLGDARQSHDPHPHAAD